MPLPASGCLLCLGDALAWAATNLGTPILTGVAAGLALALVLEWRRIPRDVAENERQVRELVAEFGRFVLDLAGEVDREISRIRQGQIKDTVREMVRKDRGEEEKPAGQAQLLLNQRGRRDEAEAAMASALWRYRDQAIEKRSAYVALASRESSWHRAHRRRKKLTPMPLALRERAREAVASWRTRPSSVGGADPLEARHDPTDMEMAIEVFELAGGLSWEAASER